MVTTARPARTNDAARWRRQPQNDRLSNLAGVTGPIEPDRRRLLVLINPASVRILLRRSHAAPAGLREVIPLFDWDAIYRGTDGAGRTDRRRGALVERAPRTRSPRISRGSASLWLGSNVEGVAAPSATKCVTVRFGVRV
jgi:hypothetical protein